MVKVLMVNDCQDCPFYEGFIGRTHTYHTCHHSNKTVKDDFTILFRFCELEELEEVKE